MSTEPLCEADARDESGLKPKDLIVQGSYFCEADARDESGLKLIQLPEGAVAVCEAHDRDESGVKHIAPGLNLRDGLSEAHDPDESELKPNQVPTPYPCNV